MVSVLCFGNAFTRLAVNAVSVTSARNISRCSNPLYFYPTSVLFAEPLKKRKKVDASLTRQREERRKRKLEKQIRRLEKFSKQLKPIDGIHVPPKLIMEKETRTRGPQSLSEEELDRRALLMKTWGKYKLSQHLADMQAVDSMLFSQQHALDELRAESEELYMEAIQLDLSILPHTTAGPVHTSPIHNYDAPDGEYINLTQKFEGET